MWVQVANLPEYILSKVYLAVARINYNENKDIHRHLTAQQLLMYLPSPLQVVSLVAGHGGGRKLSCIDGINTTIYYKKVPMVTNTATFNTPTLC